MTTLKLEQLGMVNQVLKNTKTKHDLELIWKNFHSSTNHICACLPVVTYKKLRERSTTYNQFVVPLPRISGEMSYVEFFYFQVKEDVIIFCSLEDYKIHGERTKPSLIMYYFLDLVDKHETVLMRGESLSLTSSEAGILSNLYQIYYLSDEKFQEVKRFHETPHLFDYQKLLPGIQIRDNSEEITNNSK
eukprot:TRINITY_DN13936_c0_g1_i1.p1 TRINITY_DN13936_c0_g1~~TRINITY_DN13936_c0_g1_i1.p1  ORF type:complete len:189 (-),score=30.62 TRINITY_DN13936_c0_g1_i1:63-629(-)